MNIRTGRSALLALGSAFGYTMLTLYSRTLSGRYHALQPITVGFASGAVMLLPFALATGFVTTYPAAGWALEMYNDARFTQPGPDGEVVLDFYIPCQEPARA